MKRQVQAAAVAAALLPLAVSAQPTSVSLSDVAHRLGYHYAYLGPDEAVALSRPGIVVIVRPGAPLFDMNDRSIPVTGEVPYYKNGDLYVSPGMMGTLRKLAGPNAAVGRDATANMQPMSVARHVAPSIASLSAMHIEGDQALRVEGHATPFAPITLTLMAQVSRSIPDVVVSRMHVSADRSGFFSGRVAIAPVYFTGSLYTVVAATSADTSRAVTTVVSEFPNGHTQVPSEELERGMH